MILSLDAGDCLRQSSRLGLQWWWQELRRQRGREGQDGDGGEKDKE